MAINTDIYRVIWDSEEDGLLYGVSIVDKPANQYETLQLKEQEPIELQIENKEKRQLAGVVLIPNQKIRRYTEERGEFDVIFEADTIEKVAHNIFKGDYHKNSWYNHNRKERIEGSTIVESWIINDENKDKAVSMGFKDLPKGTWMCIMQLSEEAWETYVKTGKVKGFSIDSMMSLEKIELKDSNKNSINEINMKMKNFAKEFLNLLQETNKEMDKKEISMVTIETEKGKLEVDSLEVGKEVMLDNSLFSGQEFVFDDMVYTTDEEGKISDIKPVEVEVDATEKDEPQLDLTDEEAKKELFDMIEKDEELMMVLKERYATKDSEAIDMSLQIAEKDEDVKSKFKKLFLEEINLKQAEIETRDAKIAELEAKLDETPSTGKLKAKVNLSKNTDKPLTGLEAIRSTMSKVKQK